MNLTNEKKIKVLFLARWYPNKDSEMDGIFIKRHAQAVSLFCDVCVLYIHYGTKKQKTIVEYSIEDKIKTIRVYPKSLQLKNGIFKNMNFLINSFKGMKVIKKEFGRPDIVHVNVTLPMGILAVLLDIFKGIPYVVTEHFSEFTNQTKIIKKSFILNIILKRARQIIPVSEYLEQSLKFFYQTEKIIVIPNTIDTDIFFSKNSINNRSKKQILVVSRLFDKTKNISGIIKAICEISNIREDFVLNIIGDGPDRNSLESLSIRLGISISFVIFRGYVPNSEIAKIMRESDFFILNSNYETFSVVCLEALSSGIPVISTRCGGPEEFINENVGILIEKGNQQELIDSINYMLDNFNKYDAKMLHKYVENKFGLDIIGKRIYSLYLDALT
jgi:glycosyltransferase involved in cell wall biosynthesis